MSLTKFVLIIEYDGTRYHGFQWQLGLPTIQAEMEEAIRKLYGQSSRVISASRTDAGVHAKGQVVSFWAKPAVDTTTLVKALNHYLPSDIAVKAAHRAGNDFNVRRDALSREYRYYILNRDTRSPFSKTFALFMPKMLDIQLMSKACQLMQGEHDFISFATSLDNVKNTVRHVYEAKVDKREGFVVFYIEANSFLPHQVRNTLGPLIRLGLDKMGIEEFHDIMEAKKLGLAGPTAPAHGLWLIKVNYSKPLGE
ncbi:MAG TPA: tRNA pseudouridine(38-40) synthase TruA [Dehalococcoidia bacterium]|nr:tRNA pseudouridine(38-40) synthase TruA [Dehalococcoidia bacterium]